MARPEKESIRSLMVCYRLSSIKECISDTIIINSHPYFSTGKILKSYIMQQNSKIVNFSEEYFYVQSRSEDTKNKESHQ